MTALDLATAALRPHAQGCIRREGASEAAPEAVRQAVGRVAKAVGGGYCRLQMPLKLALAVRETVARHRLGALEGALPMHTCPRPFEGHGIYCESDGVPRREAVVTGDADVMDCVGGACAAAPASGKVPERMWALLHCVRFDGLEVRWALRDTDHRRSRAAVSHGAPPGAVASGRRCARIRGTARKIGPAEGGGGGGGGGTVKRPRQQPAHPQYANYWAPLTRKRHTMPHSAQPQHTNHWAPRTRKRHQQEHRPQRPTESSDPTQHAKGRTGDRPGPRKGATTRRNVTQGGGETGSDRGNKGMGGKGRNLRQNRGGQNQRRRRGHRAA